MDISKSIIDLDNEKVIKQRESMLMPRQVFKQTFFYASMRVYRKCLSHLRNRWSIIFDVDISFPFSHISKYIIQWENPLPWRQSQAISKERTTFIR